MAYTYLEAIADRTAGYVVSWSACKESQDRSLKLVVSALLSSAAALLWRGQDGYPHMDVVLSHAGESQKLGPLI